MRYFFPAVFIVLNFTAPVFSQLNRFPDGVYLNLESLKKRTPNYNARLVVERRTPNEIKYNGGNEYRLVSPKDSLSQHYIKKKMFAYAKNDTLFLNGSALELGPWYSMAITKGNFICLNARDMQPDRNEQARNAGFANFGLVGAALATAYAEINWSRYVLSLRSGYLGPLRKEFLMKKLREKMELLEAYVTEKEQDSFATMYKYFEELNASVPPDVEKPE